MHAWRFLAERCGGLFSRLAAFRLQRLGNELRRNSQTACTAISSSCTSERRGCANSVDVDHFRRQIASTARPLSLRATKKVVAKGRLNRLIITLLIGTSASAKINISGPVARNLSFWVARDGPYVVVLQLKPQQCCYCWHRDAPGIGRCCFVSTRSTLNLSHRQTSTSVSLPTSSSTRFSRPLRLDASDGFSPDELSLLAVLLNPELRGERDRRELASAQVLQARLLPNPQLGFGSGIPHGWPDHRHGQCLRPRFELGSQHADRPLSTHRRGGGPTQRRGAWTSPGRSGWSPSPASRPLTR